MVPVRFAYDRVLLRRFVAEDAECVAHLCSDWAVAGTTALIPHPYTHAHALEWIASQEPPSASAAEHVYAVARRDDELIVGAIGLRSVPGDRDNLGYWIGRPHWGRGYATSAAAAMIGLAFAQLGFDAVTAAHLARNPASGRVMEKCGMAPVREEMRLHRGGAQERFRVWRIDLPRWQAWTGTYSE